MDNGFPAQIEHQAQHPYHPLSRKFCEHVDLLYKE